MELCKDHLRDGKERHIKSELFRLFLVVFLRLHGREVVEIISK